MKKHSNKKIKTRIIAGALSAITVFSVMGAVRCEFTNERYSTYCLCVFVNAASHKKTGSATRRDISFIVPEYLFIASLLSQSCTASPLGFHRWSVFPPP